MIERPKQYDPFFSAFTEAWMPLRATGGSVFIYPHVHADCDALGTALALALLFERFGLESRVYAEEEVSEKLAFLPAAQRLVHVAAEDEAERRAFAAGQSLALVIDSPGGHRIGRRLSCFESAPLRFVIDHHIPQSPPEGNSLIAVEAAASSELIAAYVLYLEARLGKALLDEAMAANLFCGMMTDTGRFTYSNTTAQTLAMASVMLRFPLKVRDYSLRLFDEMSRAKLALSAYVFANVRFDFDGRLATALIPHGILEELSVKEGDVEGLASQLREIRGVDISILFRESEPGTFRASLRSGEGFDAQRLALELGGGGHQRAAGFTAKATDAEALRARCRALVGAQLSA